MIEEAWFEPGRGKWSLYPSLQTVCGTRPVFYSVTTSAIFPGVGVGGGGGGDKAKVKENMKNTKALPNSHELAPSPYPEPAESSARYFLFIEKPLQWYSAP